MSDDNRARMHVYLNPSFREKLRQAADQCDLSMAAYIRRAVTLQMQRDVVQSSGSKTRQAPQGVPAPDFLRHPKEAV